MVSVVINICHSFVFLGTLNPALQDRNGQPKRDITTIIHILNDLLCAQYKNYTSPSDSPIPSTSTAGAPSTVTATSSSRTRSSEPHQNDYIIKPTSSSSAPCSCSNDPSVEANSSLLQSTANKPINKCESISSGSDINRNAELQSPPNLIG